MNTTGSTYVLGHADVEVQRLLLQGRLYNDYTEHALRLAGLRTGMRVLDVGSGPGDVSLIAARLVGPTGSVLGVDAAPEMIDLARTRAAEQGLTAARFVPGTVDAIALDEPVDAVVGRLILMHLPEPAATVRRLSSLVRPGGVMVFSENDITRVSTVPDMALFRQVSEGIARSFEAMGLSAQFGTTLPTVFRDAGLGTPQLVLSAPVGTAADTDILAYATEVWRLVYPTAQQLGITVGDLADVDAMLPRFREEAAAVDAVITMPPIITAWARVP
ncbi:methyltransferase domain-containing protein [Mycobacterium shimoidei]|uniref:Type 11 methyltransferase [Corallococcus coralloides DSM 2259] n=1 Tax=Mycobacterium shimoidei TaxID=29313 RepID=A0A1E3TIE1_MYCSH|nr:methyltransferase domain-containing protein [Mycobacterium shimoidei]MCV7257831.1 methyltransferase domain-containing protein [Mycobacterium shimoidei]ODR14214.1 methylase [Mycobacterium shimoidei]ORW83890.1 methylase [Mycobacterium shimoidei]SRX91911.1 type 11 methyltransferase [Corallococcus coralloides DSM 2259] [Mycobacterium shimoidei]